MAKSILNEYLPVEHTNQVNATETTAARQKRKKSEGMIASAVDCCFWWRHSAGTAKLVDCTNFDEPENGRFARKAM